MTPHQFKEAYDVVIIGAGPGGSACALSLLKKGLRPLIIEKQTFPRYQIGESLTGEMGRQLREMGLESFMNEEHNFPVKRGVKIWGKDGQNDFFIPVMKVGQDGNLEDSTTWQVRRDDFDNGLLEIAKARGADFLQATAKAPIMNGDRVAGVQVTTADGRTRDICARMVVDASGQATFLASKGKVTSPVQRGNYDRQLAVFSQVKGALRGGDGTNPDDTIIFYRERNHWGWFIPLSDAIVSIGIVTPAAYFREKGLSKEEFYKEELYSLNTKLTERLENAEIVLDVHSASNYSYCVDEFVGPGFVCIGDSHRFIDPIFSFGLHFTFHEGLFAADAIAEYLACEDGDLAPLLRFQDEANAGQQIIQDFIDCFWEFPLPFLIMAHFQYRDQFIDIFAGRVYGKAGEMDAVKELRRQLSKKEHSILEPA